MKDLLSSIDPARLPAHIAIIMDGNGRWARRRNLPRVAGHKAGIDAVRSTVETCTELGIQALTLYAFSAENWKRPRAEVDTLWRLLRLYLSRELPAILRNGIRFTCMGRMDQLPAPVRQELETVIDATAHNTGMCLNLAINYSGRAELVDAVNAIIEDARLEGRLRELQIDERAIAVAAVHGGAARSRSFDPDIRRDAHQQFPAVADRLCRVVRHGYFMARFPARGSAACDSGLSEARPPVWRLESRRSRGDRVG